MSQDSIDRFQQEYQNNAATRRENDQLLLGQIDDIKNGHAIDALARFARAYLGMYLDIDNSVPPQQRIQLLANSELTAAVLKGFSVTLEYGRFPGLQAIADSLVDESPLEIGYIVLAGLSILSSDNPDKILPLPETTLASAIGFHFVNKTELDDNWFVVLLEKKQRLVSDTLICFWTRLIERDTDYLPGLYQIISHQQYDVISEQVILPVLENWKQHNKSTLRDLLHTALRLADRKKLLSVCEASLEKSNRGDPGRYILWLATTCLLAPEKYDMVLTDYAGRSKEKILPLLDFVVMVLLTDNNNRLAINSDIIAQLLRIIAPKFTPQQDRYGNLCDNTQKVMYLFYRLAISSDDGAKAATKRLGMIRVMKLYDDILEYISSLQQQPAREPALEFEAFIHNLAEEDRIRSRKKWSDRSIKSG